MKRNSLIISLIVGAALFAGWLARTETVEAQIPNVPVGSVLAWSGPKSKIPNGWLECDGSELNRTGQFANLFNAIGTTWGGTATDKFKIPDLRGYFLRGVSGGSGRDEDVAGRNPAGNGPVNDAGSIQDDAFENHRHDISPQINVGHTVNGNGSARRIDTDDGGSWSNIDEDQFAMSSGGSETRPKNAYVYFIIRAR